MNHYELLYIVPATHSEEEVQPIKSKINAAVTKYGGRIMFEESLGKRKLAYPIKKFRHGHYLLVEFDAEPSEIKQLDDELRLTNEVIRHLIVRKDPRALKTKPTRQITGESVPLDTGSPDSTKARPIKQKGDENKVKLEDLDKKLDEILEGDIL